MAERVDGLEVKVLDLAAALGFVEVVKRHRTIANEHAERARQSYERSMRDIDSAFLRNVSLALDDMTRSLRGDDDSDERSEDD